LRQTVFYPDPPCLELRTEATQTRGAPRESTVQCQFLPCDGLESRGWVMPASDAASFGLTMSDSQRHSGHQPRVECDLRTIQICPVCTVISVLL